jgi:hypothetical protein
MLAHISEGVFERALAQLCAIGFLVVLGIAGLIWLAVKFSGRKGDDP